MTGGTMATAGPALGRVYRLMGDICHGKQEFDQAVEYYRKAVEPDDGTKSEADYKLREPAERAHVYRQLAECYARLGYPDRVQQCERIADDESRAAGAQQQD